MNLIKNLKRKGIILVMNSCLLAIFLLLGGCSISNNRIVLVRIFYLPEDLSVMTPIDDCTKIFYYTDILKDTVINDLAFIKSFDKKIKGLKLSEIQNTSYDLRIRCVIKMQNGDKKILCLGEFFDTVYEGQLFNDDQELFKQIKNVVYN